MRRVVAVAVAGVLVLAACSSSGGSVEEFCEKAQDFAAVEDPFEGDPAQFSDRLDETKDAINGLVDAAPSEIKDDVETVADGSLQIIDALEGVDTNDEDALFEALSSIDEIGPEVDAASDRVNEYTIAECGIDLNE